MRVEVAKTAGFCFGVDRAVSTVYKLLEEGKQAATLGPIIHNPQVTGDLAARGVVTVSRPQGDPRGLHLGDPLPRGGPGGGGGNPGAGLPYVDATCPFVKKIHQLAAESGEQGKVFLLAGDKDHPEVKGILGPLQRENFTVKKQPGIGGFAEKPSRIADETPGFRGPNHFHAGEWEKCLETLKKLCTNAAVFATICNAYCETAERSKNPCPALRQDDCGGGQGQFEHGKAARHLRGTLRDVPHRKGGRAACVFGRAERWHHCGGIHAASIIKEVLATMQK